MSGNSPSSKADCACNRPAGPVMLALSTFRQSGKAVELAIERAADSGKLIVVWVVDRNLARYYIGSDVGLMAGKKEQCEEEVLAEHERQGCKKAEAIAQRAREKGIEASVHVRVGRFALVCLEIVEAERPSLIVTRRSERPAWVKKFFGSPVDELIARAGCPVIEA